MVVLTVLRLAAARDVLMAAMWVVWKASMTVACLAAKKVSLQAATMVVKTAVTKAVY